MVILEKATAAGLRMRTISGEEIRSLRDESVARGTEI